MAVWSQALNNEPALIGMFCNTCALTDLEKADGRVTHQLHVRSCLRHNFSIRRVRVLFVV
eukprot:7207525-Pyramimonas_sp.AAC.1